MSELVLTFFGHPRIEYNGTPIDLARRKAVALLVYVAVTKQHHGRDVLAALFWPELDQTNARADLRRTFSTLTTEIGNSWFETDTDTIGINWDANVWLDIAEFRMLLVQAWQPHGHLDNEICDRCQLLLSTAVSLYKGDFLAGFTLKDSPEFDNWVAVQTQNLQREYIDALRRLANGLGAQNKFQPAIDYAQRWLAMDPLDEKAHRLLMLLYAKNDQRAAAIAQYQQCVRILESELGLEPGEDIANLYKAIYVGDPVDPGRTKVFVPTPTHLPIPTTPFIGRNQELAEIAKFLSSPAHRLLTLIGPGGIGKTRLAIRAAARAIGSFEDGAFFVPLTHVNSSQTLGYAIAEALNLGSNDQKGRTREVADDLEQVRAYLHDRRLLLVIDNFEHVIDGAPLIYDLLRTAPKVKVLATSRERLNLRGETVLALEGMSFPEWDMSTKPLSKDPHDFDAVQLFVQQAQFGQPDFSLTDDDLNMVIHICQQLAGMPLAIELAAGWTRALSVREIAGQIDEDLDFLTTSHRDTSARHESLRTVFEHSWNLLSELEQQVFSRMSVFHGGFQKDAALRVTGATLSLILALVDKSLLQWNSSGRYEVHELLRQYAEEKLDADDAEQVKKLHYDYYLEFVRERAGKLGNHENDRALKQIGDEIENLRSIFVWAIQHQTIDELKEPLEYILRVRATSRQEQLGSHESEILCRDCGHRNRVGSLFCENCHAALLRLHDIPQPRTKVVTGQAYLNGSDNSGTGSFTELSLLIIQLEDSSEAFQMPAAHVRELIIGRYDPFSASTPDIDLNPFGGLGSGVSRRHARIVRQENTLQLFDLGSSNGTYLNGQKLVPRQPRQIRHGDEIRVGKLRLYVCFRNALN